MIPADVRPAVRRAPTLALGALALGGIGVVLVALPYKAFDLDRYFVPKELVLHVTAGVAAAAALLSPGRRPGPGTRGQSTATLTRVDTLLVTFLALSALSASMAANGWLAGRALAVSASAIAAFLTSQALARSGWTRPLLAVFGAAVMVAAITSLLQAYGVESEFFSINRSPGGTLGNRNFVAHLAAIGLPPLVLCALRARRAGGMLIGATAIGIVAAALVLSRSRAAWIATALAAASVLPGARSAWRASRAHRRRRDGPADGRRSRPATRVESPARGGRRAGSDAAGSLRGRQVARRSAVLVGSALLGVGLAVRLPNTLNWRSASPYLDSVIGVANYRAGSGHGRLVQYGNTARLALTHPLLGVGPGNWSVAYPRVASRNDPSLDPDDGMTANPWPSSDWAAFISERGLVATMCLVLALAGLVVAAARSSAAAVDDARLDRLLTALTLIATIVAVLTVGAFDAVLLLPAPGLVAWGILGALAGTLFPEPAPYVDVPFPAAARSIALLAVVAAGGYATFRSASAITAMALYSAAPRTGAADHTLELASRADPGSYRIHLRLAEAYEKGRACSRSRVHARAARALYPSAPEPRRLLAACSTHTR